MGERIPTQEAMAERRGEGQDKGQEQDGEISEGTTKDSLPSCQPTPERGADQKDAEKSCRS